METGLTPVLHGDAVFDTQQGVSILSGDALMETLAAALRPTLAVFLTDVAGVYTCPPTEPNATLLAAIRVDRIGTIIEMETYEPDDDGTADRRGGGLGPATATAAHDVTGGLAAKLKAAAAIAAGGTPVVIVEVGTEHAAAALRGEFPEVCTRIERAG